MHPPVVTVFEMWGETQDKTYLRSQAGEVVGRLERASDALLDVGVPAVVGAQDGVLESAGVLQLESELAVLALLGDGDARADGGDVGVVDESYDGLVLGEDGADGALRTSCTTGANLEDFHLLQLVKIHRLRAGRGYLSGSRGGVALVRGKGWCRSDKGDESEEPLHDDGDDRYLS